MIYERILVNYLPYSERADGGFEWWIEDVDAYIYVYIYVRRRMKFKRFEVQRSDAGKYRIHFSTGEIQPVKFL